MKPEELQRLENIEKMLAMLVASDRYTFQKTLQVFDGKNIQLGRTTGTKIGTSATEKLGFFGHAPIARPAAITPPSGGGTTDASARTAISDIITTLQSLGLIA